MRLWPAHRRWALRSGGVRRQNLTRTSIGDAEDVFARFCLLLTTVLAWGRPRHDRVREQRLRRHQLAVLTRPTADGRGCFNSPDRWVGRCRIGPAATRRPEPPSVTRCAGETRSPGRGARGDGTPPTTGLLGSRCRHLRSTLGRPSRACEPWPLARSARSRSRCAGRPPFLPETR